MRKNILAALVVILILSLVLSGCERPATKATVATATSEGEIPFPVATQPQIIKDILSATQTAQAGMGTGGGLVTSTPAFTLPTTAPTSGILSTPTPTATKIVYPTPTPGRPSTYVLQKGEFPFCIARRFNVDPSALLSLNGLSMSTASNLSAGYELKIPSSGSWSGDRALKAHPTTYTVQSGDTIYTIACGFGDVDPNTILAANGLESGASLSVGQTLQIP